MQREIFSKYRLPIAWQVGRIGKSGLSFKKGEGEGGGWAEYTDSPPQLACTPVRAEYCTLNTPALQQSYISVIQPSCTLVLRQSCTWAIKALYHSYTIEIWPTCTHTLQQSFNTVIQHSITFPLLYSILTIQQSNALRILHAINLAVSNRNPSTLTILQSSNLALQQFVTLALLHYSNLAIH